MSIFKSIFDKTFHHPNANKASGPKQAAPAAPSPGSAAPAAKAAPAPAPAPQPARQPVDVEAVLTQMASPKGGGGNWPTSTSSLRAVRLESRSSNLSRSTEQKIVPGPTRSFHLRP